MSESNRGEPLTWRNFLRLGWGERLILILLFGLPLTAVGVVASAITDGLLLTTALPFWGAVLIAVPAATLVVAFFVFSMGNDAMDWIVGSLIILVLVAVLYPIFKRARELRMREKQRPAVTQPRR